MTKIKFITNFGTLSNKYFNNDRGWNNLEITNSFFADYYVILNHPFSFPFKFFNPRKTLVFQNEPYKIRSKWPFFNNLNSNLFFYSQNLNTGGNYKVWKINKHYNWLMDNKIEKSKDLSTITSDLYELEGHKKRLEFVKFLDENIEIDIFGKEKFYGQIKLSEMKNYKRELKNKEDGLFDYKYTFASENSFEKGYITEKLIDAILSETLCFYCGAPDVNKYINSDCYIKIDLNDFEKSLSIIKKSIQNDEWRKRLSSIQKEKKRILNESQLMPIIEKVINEYKN